MSSLADELPALPSHIFELNKLLSSPSVDLRSVGKIIRNDPKLSTQVLRLCNSSLFNLRRSAPDIEEAAVLVGSERLRTLVLTYSIMEFTCQQLPRVTVQTFWQHNFMTGMLSERIARWMEYSEREQAYLGGLLHDIGALPLLMVDKEENPLNGEAESGPWGGSLDAEREYFGMTHCEVGRRIGQRWNLFPSFIDVFENHHHPERSVRDPVLVGIVAAADHFAEWRGDAAKEDDPGDSADKEFAAEDEFLKLCFPRLDAKARSELTEMLETEYLHLLPVIEFSSSVEQPLAEKQV